MTQPGTMAGDRYSQMSGMLVSDMNGEKVLLSVEKGKYYNLGETGGRIWELLDTPRTIAQIADRLREEYDIEPGLCTEQVHSFVQSLLAEQLVLREEETTDR